jgi:membrane protein implicated in regulation of membrane protease activity
MMSFWQWWVLAGVLLIVEVLAPGTFFLWLAVSAAAVGLLVWLVPTTSVEAAWSLFAVLGVISVVMVLKFRKRPKEDAANRLNKRGQEYVGRVFELTEPIHNGKGKLKIGDTLWTVYGPDLPAGSQVKVMGVESGEFTVQQA